MTKLLDLGVDFETFYASDYTLNDLTTTEYVLDPRFQVIGVSLCFRGEQPRWISGTHAMIKEELQKLPWDRIRVIAHNAMFDGSILEWIFGCVPAEYLCTMTGSRPHFVPYAKGQGLAAIASYLGIGTKGTAVHQFKGMRREDFAPHQLAEYGVYCCNDTMLSLGISEKIAEILPADELKLLDLTIKKFTRPILQLNAATLNARANQIDSLRTAALADLIPLGVNEDLLRSRPAFASKLAELGVPIPMKKSEATGEDTFAFAKDDLEFIELRNHANSDVRQLVNAKLMFSSNQETTRIKRLLSIAAISDPPLLAVPLVYYGAHTGRFSGADKLNLQNLNRVDPDKPESGALRYAIVAPPGYKILAADLKNIEARVVATLAGQTDLIAAFRRDADVYSEFATRIYGRPITKVNKTERFVGKTCILGLGYGMGPAKFHFGMEVAEVPMTVKQASDVVYLYRGTYAEIPKLWANLNNIVMSSLPLKGGLATFGPLGFVHERILLPNGMPIIYPGICIDRFGQLSFNSRKSKARAEDLMTADDSGKIKLWGGAITENVVQALARIILTRAELRLAKLGLEAALQVHDELVYCVREEHVEAVKRAVTMAMVDPVPWMPNLPIAVEIGVGDTYGDCK